MQSEECLELDRLTAPARFSPHASQYGIFKNFEHDRHSSYRN